MNWTTARTETLRRSWNEGDSASEIAVKLRGVTRNAVIGKAHRLGLTGKDKPHEERRRCRKGPPKPPPGPRGRPRKSVAAPKPAPKLVVVGPYPPVSRHLSIFDLTSTTCRWPIGDPRHSDFGFCGCETRGHTYCPFHRRLARWTYYAPAVVRRAA